MKLKPTIREIKGWQDLTAFLIMSKVRAAGYDKPLTKSRVERALLSMKDSLHESDEPKKPAKKVDQDTPKKKKPKAEKKPDIIKFGDPKHATPGYSWLSNMMPCAIYLKVPKGFGTDGYMMFYSVEQAFQWTKTISAETRVKIHNCIKPKDARYQGSEKAGCVLRDEWSEAGFKEAIMLEILKSKFSQNKVLCDKLINTDDIPLYEIAPWDKQKFWGVNAELIGENKTACLIMKVRKHLTSTSEYYTGTLK